MRMRNVAYGGVLFSLLGLAACGGSGGSSTAVAVVGTSVTETVTTFAENGSGSFSVVLTKAPDGDVAFTIVSTDTTEANVSVGQLVFTVDNWNVAQTVNLAGVLDNLADGNRSFDINIAVDPATTTDKTGYASLAARAVNVTVQDIDQVGVTVIETNTAFSETGTGSMDIMLNTIPDGPVAITITSSDSTEALVSSDGGTTTATTLTLIFDASNWNVAETVTLLGQTDAGSPDGNKNITISVEVDAILTTDTSGYAGLAGSPLANVATQVLDSNSITVSVVNANTTLKEGGASGSFGLVLNSAPDGDVVVTAASSDTTEFQVSSAANTTPATSVEVVFTSANWNVAQVINLHPLTDNIADGNQNVQANLAINTASTTDTTGYAALTPASMGPVAVVVNDVDQNGLTIGGVFSTAEDQTRTASVTVNLNTIPDGNVVLTFTSSDTSELLMDNTVDAAAATATLTFTPNDWNTPQTMYFAGVTDSMIDGNQTVPYTISVDQGLTTDTTGYKAVNPMPFVAQNTVTVTDVDKAGLNASISPTTLMENTTETATISVQLNTIPDGDVVLDVTASSAVELSIAGGTKAATQTLTFTANDWSTPQTVTAFPVYDSGITGDRVATVDVNANAATTDTTGYGSLSTITLPQITVRDAEAPLYMFRTNSKFQGNFAIGYASVREAADALVNNDTNIPAQCSGRTVRALISTSTSDSISNFPATYGFSSSRSVRTKGETLLATSWADLIDGNVPNASTASLTGGTVNLSGYAWTASNNFGAYSSAGGGRNCNNWTSNISGGGDYGTSSQASLFSTNILLSCQQSLTLYGICY